MWIERDNAAIKTKQTEFLLENKLLGISFIVDCEAVYQI